MQKQVYLHIPEPCHENWDAMPSAQQGRFCDSCSKEVIDFSGMTDRQILDVLSKAAGKTCGRFTGSQLERPVQPEISFFLTPYKIILSSLLPTFIFAGTAAAQSKPAKKPPTSFSHLTQQPAILGAILMAVPDTSTVKGRIADEKGNPVGGATIQVAGTQTSTFSDRTGHFSLPFPAQAKPGRLLVTHPGHETTEVDINGDQATPYDIRLKPQEVMILGEISNIGRKRAQKPVLPPANTEKKTIMKGKIVNAGGEPLPFATAGLKNHAKVVADSTGYFSLSLEGTERGELVASHVGYHDTSAGFDFRKDILPCVTLVLEQNNTLPEATVAGYALKALTGVAGGISIVRTVSRADTARMFVQKLFNNDMFKTFPNPVARGRSVQLSFRKGGDYSIQLFDNSGRLYAAKQLRLDGAALAEQFSIPPGIGAGIYYISATNLSVNKRFVDKIIVQ